MSSFVQYQDLIGVIITLLAAFLGFGGVIYSQRSLARMSEQERIHREKHALDLIEGQRKAELRSFANAMIGELSALQQGIQNSLKLLLAQITLADEMGKMATGKKTHPRVNFNFDTPVYDSHVARLGLLSPELSFKVANLYGSLRMFASRPQEQVMEMDAALAARIMRSIYETLQKLPNEIEELKTELRSG